MNPKISRDAVITTMELFTKHYLRQPNDPPRDVDETEILAKAITYVGDQLGKMNCILESMANLMLDH